MRPLVLGILNVTPDSFSDGGSYSASSSAPEQIDLDAAVSRVDEMLAEGADMIDVGGESTRPGAEPIPIDVELNRVIPVIEAIAGRARISIDTRNEPVARAAVAAGAEMINDVSASLHRVAADTGAAWVAMHMLGVPGIMQQNPQYDDVVADVRDFLVERAEAAVSDGVEEVWIDPGFGFGKTLDHNLDLLTGMGDLVATGFPVVVGTSRKSMLGQLIARSDGVDAPVPASDRLEGSVTTGTYALMLGARMIRVHDVKAAAQAVSVVTGIGRQELEAIRQSEQPGRPLVDKEGSA